MTTQKKRAHSGVIPAGTSPSAEARITWEWLSVSPEHDGWSHLVKRTTPPPPAPTVERRVGVEPSEEELESQVG
ncbi:MAG: hypothetical protein ACFCGT_01515 [Sandaracinaceae bacterium]